MPSSVMTEQQRMPSRSQHARRRPPQQRGLQSAQEVVVQSQLLQHLRAETSALCSIKPDAEVVKSVIRLAWASSSGNYPLLNTPWEELGPIPLAIGTVHYQDEYITEEIQVM